MMTASEIYFRAVSDLGKLQAATRREREQKRRQHERPQRLLGGCLLYRLPVRLR